MEKINSVRSCGKVRIILNKIMYKSFILFDIIILPIYYYEFTK